MIDGFWVILSQELEFILPRSGEIKANACKELGTLTFYWNTFYSTVMNIRTFCAVIFNGQCREFAMNFKSSFYVLWEKLIFGTEFSTQQLLDICDFIEKVS